ncbi:MAG: diacylglycerol kinase family protein [Phycisphaerales bacterium]
MGDDGRGARPNPHARLPLRPLNVVVLHNPRSGRGLAKSIAQGIHDHFEARGHAAKLLAVGDAERLDPDKLALARALVVVGGDGTVNHATDAAIAACVPLYHAPTGNENLFARALSMTRDPEEVVRAVEEGRSALADVGTCAGHTFLITAGFGPDAGVIRRLTATRTRAIGHRAYVEPILREACRPHLPRLWVEADGRPVVEGARGVLVVGNSREYASHLNPCPGASLFSGRLEMTFLPARSTVGVAGWALALWARRAASSRRATAVGATELRVRSESPMLAQIDGELLPDGGPTNGAHEIVVGVRPSVLRVVLTAQARVPRECKNGQTSKFS